MPLKALIRWASGSQLPAEKTEAQVVGESLLMELDYQLREAEEILKRKEMVERRQDWGVDYAWLVRPQRKKFEVPQLERLELEELCMKVKPEESGKIISTFRESLVREPPIEEISKFLRACIYQVLDERPVEDSMSDWMMKGLTKMKPNPKVQPIDFGGDHAQRSVSVTSSTMFQTVDDLPV